MKVIFVAGLVAASLQTSSSYVTVHPAQGYAPPTILVHVGTPDAAQICAESPNGLAACRAVDEFRQWVRARTDQKKGF